ncbi:hypothetical protein K2173_000740 [Erythroxylum novogranatense]|uniref:Uncharacterized protein n=1 Tax=Erythroxylum novogranatense TaxID=1862640 RepID=A0AAV8T2S6_9ROSI|nr:hypothetical protein K2173_000740 [Erythroxylum novogranatense]
MTYITRQLKGYIYISSFRGFMAGLLRPPLSKRPRSSDREEAPDPTDHNTVDPLGDSTAACEMDEVEQGFNVVAKSNNLLKDELLSLKYSGDGRKLERGEGSNRFAGLVDEMEEAESVERTHVEYGRCLLHTNKKHAEL